MTQAVPCVKCNPRWGARVFTFPYLVPSLADHTMVPPPHSETHPSCRRLAWTLLRKHPKLSCEQRKADLPKDNTVHSRRVRANQGVGGKRRVEETKGTLFQEAGAGEGRKRSVARLQGGNRRRRTTGADPGIPEAGTMALQMFSCNQCCCRGALKLQDFSPLSASPFVSFRQLSAKEKGGGERAGRRRTDFVLLSCPPRFLKKKTGVASLLRMEIRTWMLQGSCSEFTGWCTKERASFLCSQFRLV